MPTEAVQAFDDSPSAPVDRQELLATDPVRVTQLRRGVVCGAGKDVHRHPPRRVAQLTVQDPEPRGISAASTQRRYWTVPSATLLSEAT